MILIALVAAGFALSGSITNATMGFLNRTRLDSQLEIVRKTALQKPLSPKHLAYASSGLALHVSMLLVPLLATISIGMIPINLIPPRPRWRRLVLQPGAAAALAAVVGIACVAGFFGTARLVESKGAELKAGDAAFAVMLLPVFAGFSTASAWTTIANAGLWRAEPTWIDRLGRIVAVAWIVLGIFNTCHYLIFGFAFAANGALIRY